MIAATPLAHFWAAVIAVSIGPGQTQFTRMPRPPYSAAATLVRPTTPCLAAV